MKRYLGLLIFLLSHQAWGTPEKISVFFLSEQRSISLQQTLEQIQNKEAIRPLLGLIAQNNFECTPMGDGCFHPQLGYIEDQEKILKPTETKLPEFGDLKTINSEDVQMIECREGNYFDIFCGQAKKEKARPKAQLEIWLDVSASMRKTDYSKDLTHCHRRSFVEALAHRCEARPEVSVYNTSIKPIMDNSAICVTTGTNSAERTIDWIQGSNAKHLVIVTDTEEYSGAFRDFLTQENATLYGLDAKSLYVEDLIEMSDLLLGSCKTSKK